MSSFTQNVILDTFGRLLECNSFDRITVSGIIAESNISRNTFYYHYRDIYGLLDAWMEDKLLNFDITPENDDWLEGIKTFFKACVDSKRWIDHLLNSKARDHVERYIYSYTGKAAYRYAVTHMAGVEVNSKKAAAVSDIIRYTIIGYFLRFYWDGMTEDVDKSVGDLGRIFEDLIRYELIE